MCDKRQGIAARPLQRQGSNSAAMQQHAPHAACLHRLLDAAVRLVAGRLVARHGPAGGDGLLEEEVITGRRVERHDRLRVETKSKSRLCAAASKTLTVITW